MTPESAGAADAAGPSGAEPPGQPPGQLLVRAAAFGTAPIGLLAAAVGAADDLDRERRVDGRARADGRRARRPRPDHAPLAVPGAPLGGHRRRCHTRSGSAVGDLAIAPINRIQTIDSHRWFGERLFGLANVTATTASAACRSHPRPRPRAPRTGSSTKLTAATGALPGDAT